MSLLALDVGSSSIKGALLELDPPRVGEVVAEPFPPPVAGLEPGWFEVEPRLVVAACQRVVERLAATTHQVDAFVSCGQMGGVILVDGAGQPRTNYLSWRDQRALGTLPSSDGSYFDRLRESLTSDDWRALGREVQPGSALCLLSWLAHHRQLPAGDVTPLSLGDHVLQQLAGGRPAMTFTQAIGLVDLNTMTFRRDLFTRLGIDHLHWPELVDERTVIGRRRLAGHWVPCYPCVGDHQCALAGTGLALGELSINVSTGSQVGLLAPRFTPGEYQTRPYFGGLLLNALTHLPAGRSLNVLVDLLTELPRASGATMVDPWDYLARAAADARDCELSVALTFFAGPLGQQGTIRGITTDNLSAGTLFRAAFRSMAENYAWAVERLSAGRTWDRLVLSGGLVQKVGLLREWIIERIGGPYRVATNQEETLGGLAMLSQQRLDKP